MKERRGEVEAKVEAEVDLFALLQRSITVPLPTLPPEAEVEVEARGGVSTLFVIDFVPICIQPSFSPYYFYY